uniref:Uncharacterized protein n=1 Tax=Vespula pensylvanica TaxID=30213 RepID=A0A834KCM6_VESPE|nr:hypothetical protein H0235_014972 [Vespula pensylvanica]
MRQGELASRDAWTTTKRVSRGVVGGGYGRPIGKRHVRRGVHSSPDPVTTLLSGLGTKREREIEKEKEKDGLSRSDLPSPESSKTLLLLHPPFTLLSSSFAESSPILDNGQAPDYRDGGGGGGRSSVGDGDGDGGGGGGAWTTRDARGGRREVDRWDGMKKVGLWSCAALCGGAGGE